jgi:cytidine deaminase
MSAAAELLAGAREVARNAYAPYSRFRVGALAVAADGTVYRGVNVENAAYGSTMCAEASALAAAAAAGVHRIDTVAVGCLDAAECTPCGNCRQLMREFAVATVVVQRADGSARSHTLEELLPHSFGPEALPARPAEGLK